MPSNREPYLFDEIEVLDAQEMSKHLTDGEDLYITYSNGKYHLSGRTFYSIGVSWETYFEVTLPQARDIVSHGYADWWINVAPEMR